MYLFEADGITPRVFEAEFNDGIFRGNLEAAEGAFGGTLTASAVDAVNNLNLRGGSVATTSVVSASNVSGLGAGNTHVWTTVMSIAFATAPDDPDGGLVRVVAGWKAYNAGDSLNCWLECRILVNGVMVDYGFTPNLGSLAGYKWFVNAAHYQVGVGTHTVQLQVLTEPPSLGWVIPLITGTMKVDYLRK